MEKAQDSSEVKITQLKGIDLRRSRSNLPAGFLDRCHGLYPSQTDLLSRIPGKRLYRFLDGREILDIYQTFDGNGNIVVQNGDRIDVFTLDEFLNREETFSLTPTPSTPEEDMSYALLAHITTSGTAGGSLSGAGADSTFAKATITDELVDADGIVSLASNEFTLSTGTYRIRATVTFGFSTGQNGTLCQAGLYSVTGAAFKQYAGSAENIISSTGYGPDPATNNGNITVHLMGRFTVSGSETFAIYMAADGLTTDWYSQTYAQGNASFTGGATPQKNTYKLIEILQE